MPDDTYTPVPSRSKQLVDATYLSSFPMPVLQNHNPTPTHTQTSAPAPS